MSGILDAMHAEPLESKSTSASEILHGHLREHPRADGSGIVVVGTSAEPIHYPDGDHDRCAELESDSFWFSHRSSCLNALVRRHRIKGAMLDVGGGNGQVSQNLDGNDLECWLIEPSMDGCRNAAARGLPRVVQSTLEELALPDDCVDAIGLFDVIEHVENPATLLSEARRVIRPGGHLLVTVPAIRWLWSEHDRRAGHFRRYTSLELHRALEDAGLDTVDQGFLFGPLVLPVLLGRAVPNRLGLARHIDRARLQRHHASGPGLTGRVLDRALQRELRRVESGLWSRFGTTLAAVAAKM